MAIEIIRYNNTVSPDSSGFSDSGTDLINIIATNNFNNKTTQTGRSAEISSILFSPLVIDENDTINSIAFDMTAQAPTGAATVTIEFRNSSGVYHTSNLNFNEEVTSQRTTTFTENITLQSISSENLVVRISPDDSGIVILDTFLIIDYGIVGESKKHLTIKGGLVRLETGRLIIS